MNTPDFLPEPALTLHSTTDSRTDSIAEAMLNGTATHHPAAPGRVDFIRIPESIRDLPGAG
ncbi:hypothetical protein D477_006653 [Arthrobacter crystallopoietes BAB-32]|uniref:Uncharacterized protein n=1 Tax=Arthrobacter crystallopoietes BAB-32 TaxID=1246476 RepID=N1V9N1_9MICC|nr:hypothetical protein [Arthrobacter crystallopoietes]EMY34993.1 hypothetical protein D477_006653 [Arthrobacter crystallopoietes BAB-32]